MDPPKKKRCPAVLKMVPENNVQRMELEFNELGQVVGKNSDKFASIVGAMKNIEYCAQSISDTPGEDSIRDDAIARILGPKNRGRVRGLRFGTTPSKVDAQIQSTGRVRALESQLQTQSEKMETLEEKVEVLLKLSQQNQNKNAEDINSHAFTPQSQQGSGFHGGNEQENRSCQLLYWYKFEGDEVVAEGKIASTDPSAKMHHMPLG
ncbi:Transposase 23 domain-containing protein [Abeliophyllum distichum]|uniref:Transposase 23 domain-containing protein n=1 Tax=Abeliophyllum distichum TaxID=126358 RepID=A0ABD1TJZ3_9LAMI